MKRNLVIPFVLIFTLVTGMGLWWVQSTRARAAKAESEILKVLTADQLSEILRSQQLVDPEKTRAIVATSESRQLFLKGMREYMGLAARARREGMADDPNFKLNFKNKERALIASLYSVKLDSENKEQPITSSEQIDVFWSDPTNEQQFKTETDALAAVQRVAAEEMQSEMGVEPPLSGERLQKTRVYWAKSKIISDMARSDRDFIEQPIVKLRIKILETGILSSSYLAKNWLASIKANDDDIANYLKAHPEYNISLKRQAAERILERALAGEDFAKMAKEISEDRGSKDNGGLYTDFATGGLWPEIEAAASTMKAGEIANHLIESKDGFHILKFEKSTGDGGNKKLTIRHILLQKRFEDPSAKRLISSAPAPYKTPIEIAKSEIEKTKRQFFLDGIIAAEKIELPEDFEFEITPESSGQ